MCAYRPVGRERNATGGVPRHGGVHICIPGKLCSHSFAVWSSWLVTVCGGSSLSVVFNGSGGGEVHQLGGCSKHVGREEKRKTTGLEVGT